MSFRTRLTLRRCCQVVKKTGRGRGAPATRSREGCERLLSVYRNFRLGSISAGRDVPAQAVANRCFWRRWRTCPFSMRGGAPTKYF